MSRVYNFSAGPSALPEEVLRSVAEEMLDYEGSGMSVMEMSHRSTLFEEILNQTRETLRELLHIPKEYEILFLQGGASQQFAMVPMNLMKNRIADYIITGHWAKKAWQEARRYGRANIIASSEDRNFTYIPDGTELESSKNADYIHICHNNTIYGTQYKQLPNTKGKLLVADMSSDILSEPLDITKYGLIYFGAQKNAGCAGVTIVVIREDLITDTVLEQTPTILRYKTYSDTNSLYHTPPTYNIYICGKVLQWIKDQGGVVEMQKRNEQKAKLLYDYLDESKLFHGTACKRDRSLMNVTFTTKKEEWNQAFLKKAKERGLVELKGHRSVGGMRASLYNAMPIKGVWTLVECMKQFEKEWCYVSDL